MKIKKIETTTQLTCQRQSSMMKKPVSRIHTFFVDKLLLGSFLQCAEVENKCGDLEANISMIPMDFFRMCLVLNRW